MLSDFCTSFSERNNCSSKTNEGKNKVDHHIVIDLDPAEASANYNFVKVPITNPYYLNKHHHQILRVVDFAGRRASSSSDYINSLDTTNATLIATTCSKTSSLSADTTCKRSKQSKHSTAGVTASHADALCTTLSLSLNAMQNKHKLDQFDGKSHKSMNPSLGCRQSDSLAPAAVRSLQSKTIRTTSISHQICPHPATRANNINLSKQEQIAQYAEKLQAEYDEEVGAKLNALEFEKYFEKWDNMDNMDVRSTQYTDACMKSVVSWIYDASERYQSQSVTQMFCLCFLFMSEIVWRVWNVVMQFKMTMTLVLARTCQVHLKLVRFFKYLKCACLNCLKYWKRWSHTWDVWIKCIDEWSDKQTTRQSGFFVDKNVVEDDIFRKKPGHKTNEQAEDKGEQTRRETSKYNYNSDDMCVKVSFMELNGCRGGCKYVESGGAKTKMSAETERVGTHACT